MDANPWNHKPWWCQPWSIVLTTFTLISVSWVLFKIIWLTCLVAIPLLTWMIFFVFVWPKLIVRESRPEIYLNPDGSKRNIP